MSVKEYWACDPDDDFNDKDIKKYILSHYKTWKKSKKPLLEVYNDHLADYLYEVAEDKFNTTDETEEMFNDENGELSWVYWYCVRIEDRQREKNNVS
tara:strand:- start:244 stop:534 length:291 start_codon:yes stop_codon:yes gene_type:complete